MTRYGTSWSAMLVGAAIATLVAAFALATGPAEAKRWSSACQRFGDTPVFDLRQRPARKSITCLVNKERKQRGIGKLEGHRKLQRASQKHNDHMVDRKCFSHECPGEGSLEARLRSVDYLKGGLTRWAYGENIAWGERKSATPRAIVRSWMNSAGHRANILNPLYKEIGVGITDGTPYSPKAKGGTFTTDFGLAEG